MSEKVADEADFEPLLAAARQMTAYAYAPYSGYAVGAAALTTDGRQVTGCNVENASYGLSLCAECGLVSQLFAEGGGQIAHFVCVNGQGEVIMPCGRCRQLLCEHAAADMQLLTPAGIKSMAAVLPLAFGPHDLCQG